MKEQRGFVVQPIPEPAIQSLRKLGPVAVFEPEDRPIGKTELKEAVMGCTYIFALGGIPIDSEVLETARLCRVIGAMEIFPTGIDIRAATARGIPVTGLPNLPIISESTAELAMALILTVARRIPQAASSLRHGEWRQYQSMATVGTTLFGKTLGIVGLGSVGQRIASRGRSFGMTVLYADPRPASPGRERELGVERLSLDALLGMSDFVVLAMTLTADTQGLIDKRALARMKRTAYLVNTSRGGVIIEEDLITALERRMIAGAALDVISNEPPRAPNGPNPRLLNLPNVHLTPHIGTATIEARTEMALHVASDIQAVLAGERPSRLLNPELYGETSIEQERIG